MRIVCLSDTHNKHKQIQVPDGDVLVHAGDFTMMGQPQEITNFNDWLGTLPHKHKVVIAGNHDWLFETKSKAARRLMTNATYLRDQGVEIEGLKFWGSPWTPWFFGWAFNAVDSAGDIGMHFRKIPTDTDVLITHGPPHGILDTTFDNRIVGSNVLLQEVFRVQPKLHVFGHIHYGYGEKFFNGTHFVNAAIATDHGGNNLKQPIVVDL